MSGRSLLEALKARLETISVANGYNTNFKSVELSDPKPVLSRGRVSLPLLQIIQTKIRNEHGSSAHVKITTRFAIVLVHDKTQDDLTMEDMQQDVLRCLYGNSANPTGNTGINLGGECQNILYIETDTDVNAFEMNRVYTMWFDIVRHGKTYEG